MRCSVNFFESRLTCGRSAASFSFFYICNFILSHCSNILAMHAAFYSGSRLPFTRPRSFVSEFYFHFVFEFTIFSIFVAKTGAGERERARAWGNFNTSFRTWKATIRTLHSYFFSLSLSNAFRLVECAIARETLHQNTMCRHTQHRRRRQQRRNYILVLAGGGYSISFWHLRDVCAL